MKKLTVFLGGTCGNSTWREQLLPLLNQLVEPFNPVVPNWTKECQIIEDEHKKNDDINLFVLTPETNSPYSLFEIGVETSIHPEKTIVCFLDNQSGMSFEGTQKKAVNKIARDLTGIVPVFDSLENLATFINNVAEKTNQTNDEDCN